MGKHLTAEASELLCRVFRHHKGKWDHIMADPEIKALGVERWNLQHHMAYKKRLSSKGVKGRHEKRTISQTGSSSSSSASSASSSSSSVDEEEEFELLAITGRKKAQGKTPGKWYAVYSDGDERWVPASCFIDLDGASNELFLKFQANHPGDDYIKPQPLQNEKKRPLMLKVDEPEKKRKIEHEEVPQNKIVLKMPLTTSPALKQPSKEQQPPIMEKAEVRQTPIKSSKKLVCLKMLQELVEEENGLESEATRLGEELEKMRAKSVLQEETASALKKQVAEMRHEFEKTRQQPVERERYLANEVRLLKDEMNEMRDEYDNRMDTLIDYQQQLLALLKSLNPVNGKGHVPSCPTIK